MALKVRCTCNIQGILVPQHVQSGSDSGGYAVTLPDLTDYGDIDIGDSPRRFQDEQELNSVLSQIWTHHLIKVTHRLSQLSATIPGQA